MFETVSLRTLKRSTVQIWHHHMSILARFARWLVKVSIQHSGFIRAWAHKFSWLCKAPKSFWIFTAKYWRNVRKVWHCYIWSFQSNFHLMFSCSWPKIFRQENGPFSMIRITKNSQKHRFSQTLLLLYLATGGFKRIFCTVPLSFVKKFVSFVITKATLW